MNISYTDVSLCHFIPSSFIKAVGLRSTVAWKEEVDNVQGSAAL